jgi:BsuBI/PstI restriction endonuclease domain
LGFSTPIICIAATPAAFKATAAALPLGSVGYEAQPPKSVPLRGATSEITWETEVWLAEVPANLIRFGRRRCFSMGSR